MESQEQDGLYISKTRKKQLAKQVGQIAERLAAMPEKQFSLLDLPEQLADEVELARSTRGRSSQRRQIKHLAACLRKQEEALAMLVDHLADLDQVARSEKKQFHQLELLRDRLCSEQSCQDALTELEPLMTAAEIKAIARMARSVHEHNDRRAYREIFRRLQKISF